MKRKTIKFISIAIVWLLLLIPLSGCQGFPPLTAYQNFQQDQDIIYVAFYNEGEEKQLIDYREVADYRSVYSDYNARVLYDTLLPAEQQIYRLLEYALDNEYTYIFFDARLLADTVLSLDQILQFYSMDSPMVQQNLNYTVSETGYTFSYLADMFTFEITGTEFYVENFSQEAMEKKTEAIAEAEKVFATMPQGLTQLEQARYFYRYLIREVAYFDKQEKNGRQNNLYDAFVQKKTQCDGYANAFSLLCGMAQIPCAEKVLSPTEEEELGHTWNVFCADGVWYNADLSLSEEYAELHKDLDVDFTFGLSDEKKDTIPDWGGRFPACTVDLLPVEFMVKSPSDSQMLSKLKTAFKEKGRRFVYFGLEKGELSDKDLQKIANHLRFDIYMVDETVDGKKYYYIFKD